MSHATATREHTDRPTPHRRRRRRRILATVAAIVVVLAFIVMLPALARLIDDPAASEPVAGVHSVTVRDDAFAPPVIQVRPGTTVTWTFDDAGTDHNVVGDGWQSDVLAAGTYERTFSRTGSYAYTCTLHLGMDGRVDVVNP